MALTPSEKLVEELCQSSFLSLWSYANPRARAGKELSDLLVVCDPDVLIFSVKEIGLRDANDETAVARWRRKAIEESVDQLYGAERWLAGAERVIQAGGTPGLPLPALSSRRVHRIAIALGSRGEVLYEQGDFGKGFVHVLDDWSLRTVMEELDTISDFVAYLAAKERLILGGTVPIVTGGEQDLLAVYLHQGRSFPTSAPVVVIEHGAWDDLTRKPEWVRRKDADRPSYFWDQLIERVSHDVLGPGLEVGSAEEAENVMRVMAREDRFCRRMLADQFEEFMTLAMREEVRARITPSPSGATYVFLAAHHSEPREVRVQELMLRCVVARSRMAIAHHSGPVIGLATERHRPGAGSSLDAVMVDIQEWTPELQRYADGIAEDLGYFAMPRYSRASDDEYPPEPNS